MYLRTLISTISTATSATTTTMVMMFSAIHLRKKIDAETTTSAMIA